jgi:hypothetical protein
MSISAVKPKRESGSSRMKKKRGAENVIWRRAMDAQDYDFKKHLADQRMGIAITRWVLYGHLTPAQGMAGRRYADIMRKFDRFHTDTKSRTARAQNYAQGSGGEDQELERRAFDGTMDQYLADARKAKRHYNKLAKVIAPFHGAKEMLDNLCILEIEPPADHRASCAAVLSLVAKAFGITTSYDGRYKPSGKAFGIDEQHGRG